MAATQSTARPLRRQRAAGWQLQADFEPSLPAASPSPQPRCGKIASSMLQRDTSRDLLAFLLAGRPQSRARQWMHPTRAACLRSASKQ
eukprot:345446-Chlamydomonas_euryale.AAC.3